MKPYKVHHSTSILLLALVAACGGDSSSSGKGDSNRVVEDAEIEAQRAAADGSNIQGRYLAKFTTLNSQAVGTIPGSAQFMREEGRITAFVRLFAGSPSIAHFQNVHIGTRCPTISDDLNGDGYIDIEEAHKVVGPVIVPLDWDLGSQLGANRSWPRAFPNGSYEYTKETSFDLFWKDLKSTDRNTDDNIVKLAPDEGLSITGKVVMIQGVDENKVLPPSVAGYGRWRNYQTLPIACGIYLPYTDDPGVIIEDVVTGPVAPVEEGQDRPSAPGEGEDPGTGQVITGGTSNDAGSNDSGSENDGENDSSPTPVPQPETNPDENEEDDDEPRLPDICWPWENDCR